MISRTFPDGSRLDFVEDGHEYTLHRPGMEPCSTHPSDSTIAAYEPGKEPVQYAAGAATRGTLIHRALHLLEIGALPSSYLEAARGTRMEPFLHVWPKWLAHNGGELVEAECLLWGEIAGLVFVGQCDRVYRRPGGLVLVDLKTSPRKSPSHPRQVAGYAIAYAQRFGEDVEVLSIVRLCEKKGAVTVMEQILPPEARGVAEVEFTERLAWMEEAT